MAAPVTCVANGLYRTENDIFEVVTPLHDSCDHIIRNWAVLTAYNTPKQMPPLQCQVAIT